MIRVALFVLLLLLAGCDSVVKREQIGADAPTEARVSCTHPGYCMAPGPQMGFDGKMHMGMSFRFWPACPGTQKALVQTYTERWTRESGKVQTVQRRRTLEQLESCH